MKKFTYEARDQSSNKIIKSLVQAESEHAAAKLLMAQGYAPLDIKEEGASTSFLAKFKNRVSAKDKVVYLRQLATLIGAGLPLSQGLRTVAEQTQNKRLQDIGQEVIADVEGGKALSASFKKHPEAFDSTVVALVTAGEASGTLDEALRRIANQKEKDADTVRKIRGAMVYPGIVLGVILGVLTFMLIVVVPQVEKLYDDLNKTLPLLTQLLIHLQHFMTDYWYVVLLIIGISAYFFMQYLKTENGIRTKDTFKLNVPLFSKLFRKMYMARFTRTGETLLSTGVSMLDTLSISSEAVNNVVIGDAINRAAEKVKGGKALSQSLQGEEYILPMVYQMIKVGEQSGRVDEMMGKTASVYEDELDAEIKGLTTTIEPLLMVVMAVLVGGMMAATLYPIYSLVGQIT